MKLLFIHDTPFKRVGETIYALGALDDALLSRYTSLCESLVVVGRVSEEIEASDRWSKITDPKVTVLGSPSFKYDDLETQIKNCDKMIVRLPSFLGIQAMHINRKYKKPYLIEMVGDAWNALWFHSLAGKLVAPFMTLECKKYAKQAQYVLYVTQQYLQRIYPTNGLQLGCSDVVIPLPDKSVEEYRIAKIESLNPNRSDKLVLGTAAGLDVKYKGQQYVIRALGELKKRGVNKFEYWLIGGGDGDYLMHVAKECHVEDKVKIIGVLPHEKVPAWLDSLDIYLQPSKQEGLPRSIVEAMSRGLPVIGAETGGIPELISEEYRFKAQDFVRIADLLEKLTTDDLVNMSRTNFEKASEFDSTTLSKLRQDFYYKFANDNL